MTAAAAFDCQRCGACCSNPDANRASGYIGYVDVLPIERLLERPDIMRRFVETGENGAMHVRLDATGRCAALVGKMGGHVRCSIYADRPRACRTVHAGSEQCLTARRERGIVPPRRRHGVLPLVQA